MVLTDVLLYALESVLQRDRDASAGWRTCEMAFAHNCAQASIPCVLDARHTCETPPLQGCAYAHMRLLGTACANLRSVVGIKAVDLLEALISCLVQHQLSAHYKDFIAHHHVQEYIEDAEGSQG